MGRYKTLPVIVRPALIMNRILVLALVVGGVCGWGHHRHGFGGWGFNSGPDDSGSDSDESGPDSGPGFHHGPPHHGPGFHHGPPPHGPGCHHGPPPFGPDFHHGPPPHGPDFHHGPPPHGPDFGHHFNFNHGQLGKFDSAAWFVIEADRNLQNVCNASTNSVREVYENTGYRLVYSLQGYDKKSFAVKTKHRVLSLTAQKLAPSTSIFEDVRIIPNIAKGAGASWVYANDKFEVFFPYKKPLNTQSDVTCDEIDETIVNITELVLPFDYRQTDLSKTPTIPPNTFGVSDDISQSVVY